MVQKKIPVVYLLTQVILVLHDEAEAVQFRERERVCTEIELVAMVKDNLPSGLLFLQAHANTTLVCLPIQWQTDVLDGSGK